MTGLTRASPSASATAPPSRPAASMRARAAATVPGAGGRPARRWRAGPAVLVEVLGEVGEQREVAEGAHDVQRVAVVERAEQRRSAGRPARPRGAGAAPRPGSARPGRRRRSPAWSRITSPSTRPSSRMSARSRSWPSSAAGHGRSVGHAARGDVDHDGQYPGRAAEIGTGRRHGVLATVTCHRAPVAARMAARRAPLVPWRVAKARFLLSPRWLLSHLFVLLLVVTMVSLGFWQLRRLDEKRDRNALIEARMEQPVEPVEDVLAPGAEPRSATPGSAQVTATGTYDDDATVIVRNRSQDGVAGRLAGHAAGAGRRRPGGRAPGVRVARRRRRRRAGAAPEGDVTVEGLVVDPGSFDGTAPKDLEGPAGRVGDTLPGLVLAETSNPPEPDGALDRRRRRRARSSPCRRPSCRRARTSATPRSGSSSRRSPSSGTRWSCDGSCSAAARRSTTTTSSRGRSRRRARRLLHQEG